MKALTKIEQFACKYAVISKIIMTILWFLWAGQLIGPLLDSIKFEQMHFKNTPNIEIRKQARWEYADHVLAIIDRAKKLGKNYTPEQYFADRKSIDEKKRSVEEKYQARFEDVTTIEIEDIIHENVQFNRMSQERVACAATEYRDWQLGGSGARERAHSVLWQVKLVDIIKWILTLLLRGMLLASMLYLVRMCEREGVVQTIASGKRAFFRSIILWPIYLWKYPFNVIREIRIETELRRLGNAFRRLTSAEKLKVQMVARENNYREWIDEFRRIHQRNFRRSLLVALIPVILLYVFPIHAFGKTETIVKCRTVQTVQLDCYHNKAPPDLSSTNVTPSFCFEEPLILIAQRLIESIKRIPQGVKRDIDHVPLLFVICER